MTIAVDFDGTIVEHKYPKIGKERPFAIETLRKLASEGHRIILWTSREGDLLEDAIRFCKDRGLVFYAINSNQPASGLNFAGKTATTKLIADLYIDDRNIGGIPDWGEIYDIVNDVKTHRRRGRHRRFSIRKLFGL